MTVFLTEVSRKLAEKWLALLVLPGLLFLSVVGIGGAVLGQSHWGDLARLHARLDAIAADPLARTPATIILVALGVLGFSAVVGLVAQSLGRVVEACWLGRWAAPWRPLARRLTATRRRRWLRADQQYTTALKDAIRQQAKKDPTGPAITTALNAVRNRISLHEPQRPTWIGDRILAVDTRVYAAYGLDLTSVWPLIWLSLPETTRSEINTVRTQFDTATRLVGWGLLYLVLAFWWWPAGLVGVAIIALARTQGRATAHAYAQLVEAAVDLHGRDVAQSLGIDCPGPLTPEIGLAITRTLRKNT